MKVQISYYGYRADYLIRFLSSTFFHAQLTGFSASAEEAPAISIYFAKLNDQVLANSDTIKIANAILKEMYSDNSIETLAFQTHF